MAKSPLAPVGFVSTHHSRRSSMLLEFIFVISESICNFDTRLQNLRLTFPEHGYRTFRAAKLAEGRRTGCQGERWSKYLGPRVPNGNPHRYPISSNQARDVSSLKPSNCRRAALMPRFLASPASSECFLLVPNHHLQISKNTTSCTSHREFFYMIEICVPPVQHVR